MKKAVAINGSARADGSTAQLLQAALEGAKTAGAEVEFVQLSDLKGRGCKGCSKCKMLGAKNYPDCICKDDIAALIEQLKNADVIFFGSPIHYGHVSSWMQRLWERMFYTVSPSEPYSATFWPSKTPTALFLTTNQELKLDVNLKELTNAEILLHYKELQINTLPSYIAHFDRTVGSFNLRISSQVLEFTDGYDKYYTYQFDEEKIRKHHDTVFVQELEEAKRLGQKLCEQAEKTENEYIKKHFEWIKENVPELNL